MKPETQEWIEKAEGDLKVAQRERQTVDPVYDAVCFHTQQCAEKYLKALLEEHNTAFPRIHDLVTLLNLCGGFVPELDPLKSRLAHLSVFGIATRYPGMRADQQAAEEAITTAEAVRTVVRAKFGLP
jgi:HEPN domain-containing protein